MSNRVLVATDGSEFSRTTVELAARLARVLPLGVELAYVVDLHRIEYKMLADLYVDMIREGATKTAEAMLAREAAFLGERGLPAQTRILRGQPGPTLCQAAAEGGFSLLMIGRRGHGGDLQDLLFGSVSNYAVHHSRLPVLVAKRTGPVRTGDAAGRPVRVLAAVDGSRGAQRGLDALLALGTPAGLEVTLAHVVDPGRFSLEHLPAEAHFEALQRLHREGEGLLGRAAAPLRDAGFAVTTRVEEGVPAKTLCRIYEEDEFELLLMGRRGTGELADVIFGSVSNYLLHHCRGHLFLVP